MAQRQSFPAGGRRAGRPAAVHRCADCGDLTGRGYPDCPSCTTLVDGLWLADWQALLAETGSGPGSGETALAERVLAGDVGSHAWTCVDWAMWVVRCPACEHPLGTGPVGCVLCRIADETRWAWEDAAPPGVVSANEHGLRAARAALRAPHRHRGTVVLNWRLALPFLLTGEVSARAPAPWLRAYLRAGRYEELASCGSYRQLTATRELPWR
jgi:hypothetical protein